MLSHQKYLEIQLVDWQNIHNGEDSRYAIKIFQGTIVVCCEATVTQSFLNMVSRSPNLGLRLCSLDPLCPCMTYKRLFKVFWHRTDFKGHWNLRRGCQSVCGETFQPLATLLRVIPECESCINQTLNLNWLFLKIYNSEDDNVVLII